MEQIMPIITSDIFILSCEGVAIVVLMIFVILLSGKKKKYLREEEEARKKSQNDRLDDLLKNTGGRMP